MRLLEYEAKTILRNYSIPTPDALVITKRFTPEISLPVVLKSQVPVGGRGKAGGVVKVESPSEVTSTIDRIFTLDIKGYKPTAILAEQTIDIKRELYIAILINLETATIQLMAHTNGGVEVETQTGFKVWTVETGRASANQTGEQLAEYYELPDQTFALQDLVENLYKCFVGCDATLLEINPLVLTDDNKLLSADCKMELDDMAAFRHPEWKFEKTPVNTSFVELDNNGNVATIANGAGLAMATVDAVAAAGMVPANFLDIGGGANTDSILLAFNKIVAFPNIQVIVINIFAGITRCDEVAKAIIAARQKIKDLPPLCIRLAGTNFEEAASLLSSENISTLATLDDCITKAKELIYE
ncbi:MAG: succinate--CoA ligase subunit beta [Candidatus Saccharimonadales bacterium]